MGMGKGWRWSREPLCRHTGLHLRAPSTLTWSTAGSESHHLPTDGTVTVEHGAQVILFGADDESDLIFTSGEESRCERGAVARIDLIL